MISIKPKALAVVSALANHDELTMTPVQIARRTGIKGAELVDLLHDMCKAKMLVKNECPMFGAEFKLLPFKCEIDPARL